jgi:hypothetical protein
MKTTTPEERQLFRLALTIFSFVQLAAALFLFIFMNINVPTLSVITVYLIGTAVLGVKMGQKRRSVRILTRILYIAVPAAMFLLTLLTVISQFVVNVDRLSYGPILRQILESGLFFLVLFGLASLLFLFPAVVLCAKFERGFDIMMARIYSILILILSLILCFYTYSGYFVVFFSVGHVFFRILYCVCALCSALLVYISYPPKRWPFQKRFAAANKAAAKQGAADGKPEQTAER